MLFDPKVPLGGAAESIAADEIYALAKLLRLAALYPQILSNENLISREMEADGRLKIPGAPDASPISIKYAYSILEDETNRKLTCCFLVALGLLTGTYVFLLTSTVTRHAGGTLVVITLLIFLIMAVLVLLRKPYMAWSFNSASVQMIDVLHPLGQPPRLNRRARWYIWVISYRPLSFGFFWWWTLIIGLAAATLAGLHTLPPTGTSDLGQRIAMLMEHFFPEFWPALMITVLVFISENLIGQLLSTKRGLSESHDGFATATKRLADSNSALSELQNRIAGTFKESYSIQRGVEELRDKIAQASSMQHFDTVIKSLDKTIDDADSIADTVVEAIARRSLERFRQGFTAFLENLSGQLSDTLSSTLKLGALLQVLEAYLTDHNSIFNHRRKSLLGNWETLGQAAAGIVESAVSSDATSFQHLEFYTALAMTPKEFFEELGYAIVTLSPDRAMEYENPRWKQFLDTAKHAAERKIPVKRHFVAFEESSLKNNSNVRFNKLSKGAVYGELKNYYIEVDGDSGEPLEFPSDGPMGNAFRIHLGPAEHGGRSKELWQVLDGIYHMSGNCGVVTVRDQSQLFLAEGGRIIDYFAVRLRSQWQLCLLSKIDLTTKIAEIEILYELENAKQADDKEFNERWTRLKDDLDTIFLTDDQHHVCTQTLKEFMGEPDA